MKFAVLAGSSLAFAVPAHAATTIGTGTSGAVGETDTEWQVTGPGGATSNALIVNPVPGWSAPLPGTKWLQSAPNPTPTGTYVFTTSFDMATLGNVQSFVIRWLADNMVHNITLNDVVLFDIPTNNSTSQFNSVQQLTFTSNTGGLLQSNNDLSISVWNRPASNNNGGFNAEIVANAVPEPGTWLLMIIGLGAVGFAMRRRQRVSARFQFA